MGMVPPPEPPGSPSSPVPAEPPVPAQPPGPAEPASLWLFVYGTLLPGQCRHHHLASLHPLEAQEAFAEGQLYLVEDYPALTTGPGNVRGVVYRFAHPEPVFARLDPIEECFGEHNPASEYHRTCISVRLRSGQTLQAWTYLYARPVTHLPRIHSGDWLARL